MQPWKICSTMVKQGVHQGEIIIGKQDKAIAGIERLEKVLGSDGGGGGSGGDGGGGGDGDGGSSGGGDGVDAEWDFDNPFF